MVVFFPNLLIVFLLFKIEDVGLTANDTIISCPEDIPPSIPPALFELNFILFLFCEISSEFSSPDNMYKIANLDSNSIEEKVLDVLNSNIILQKQK